MPVEKTPPEKAAKLQKDAKWLKEESISPTAVVEAGAKARAAKEIREGERYWENLKKKLGVNSPY